MQERLDIFPWFHHNFNFTPGPKGFLYGSHKKCENRVHFKNEPALAWCVNTGLRAYTFKTQVLREAWKKQRVLRARVCCIAKLRHVADLSYTPSWGCVWEGDAWLASLAYEFVTAARKSTCNTPPTRHLGRGWSAASIFRVWHICPPHSLGFKTATFASQFLKPPYLGRFTNHSHVFVNLPRKGRFDKPPTRSSPLGRFAVLQHKSTGGGWNLQIWNSQILQT